MRCYKNSAKIYQSMFGSTYQRGDLAAADGEYRKALSIYQHCCGAEHSTT